MRCVLLLASLVMAACARPVSAARPAPSGHEAGGDPSAHDPAGPVETFAFAQHGQSCSPVDGFAHEYVLTRVDRACTPREGDEILTITYWGPLEPTAPSTVRTGERGSAALCRQSQGGCADVADVELTVRPTGASHLRATLPDGRVLDHDVQVVECPEHKQMCG